MRITVLASGSQGNATLVEASGTRLLIDAGLSLKELRARFEQARGQVLDRVDGIVITHSHRDHSGHAGPCGNGLDAPVYVSEASKRTLRFRKPPGLRVYGAQARFSVGEVQVYPLPLPHDAPQVALVLEHEGERMAVVTDLGHAPPDLLSHLCGCSTVLLESNHDQDMLENGPYRPALKRRVASQVGHLSNRQAAEILRHLGPETRTVVLMHLSLHNNDPAIARACAEEALLGRDVRLLVAPQHEPLRVEARVAGGQLPLPLGGPASSL